MPQQLVNGSTRFVLTQPEFDVGQRVRIRRGIYRGMSGRVSLCEWGLKESGWVYTVRLDRAAGCAQFTRDELC